MDYEQMSVQELRAECQARGLGTARARADLIKRLTDADASSDGANAPAEAESAQDVPPPQPDDTPAGPSVFRQTFTAEPGGPDEETHLAYRQTTIQAAAAAGFRTRGDARLAAVRDGQWVYEVSVRPGEPG